MEIYREGNLTKEKGVRVTIDAILPTIANVGRHENQLRVLDKNCRPRFRQR